MRTLFPAAVATVACTPLTAMQTAEVLPEGVQRITLGVGVQRDLADNYAPVPELSYQRGVGEHTELGLRVLPIGALANAKIEFWRSGELAMSFAPGFGYSRFDETIGDGPKTQLGLWTVQAPLLFGGRFGGRSDWVVGPRVVARFGRFDVASEQQGTATIDSFDVFAGAGAGIMLGATQHLRIGVEGVLLRDLVNRAGEVGELSLAFAVETGR